MPTDMAQATEMIRVDRQVADFLRREKQYPRETYNDTLRRLLGLDAPRTAEEAGREPDVRE